MSIRQAQKSDFSIVKEITQTTIQTIYPNYYPPGAVAFFLQHHNDKSIADDIAKGIVFLCHDKNNSVVGTVTIRDNEIARLFVLPEYQGKGIGRLLINEILQFINDHGVEGTDIFVELCAMPDKIPFYGKFGFSANEAQRLRLFHRVENGVIQEVNKCRER